MWPINSSYAPNDKSGKSATNSGPQSGKSLQSNTMIDGIDPNTIRLAANIRNIFGNSLSDNLLKSLGSHNESSERIADERRHDLMSHQSTRLSDVESAAKATNISDQQRRILDEIKNIDHNNDDYQYHGPQRSTFRIAINSKDNPSYDSTVLNREKHSSLQQRSSVSSHHSLPGFQSLDSVEDEDSFLYGDSAQSHNSRLPPGIVNLAQRSAATTRSMSPISERLRREDDWGRRPSPPKEIADWPINPSLAEDMREKEDMRSSLLSDKRRWLEEQLGYQKRADERNATRSPSFDRLLRSEMKRSKYKHSLYSEQLSPTNLLRNLSPPQISYFNDRERYRSPSLSPRRRSPLMSPNRDRVRKRSRSISPRRRTISPKRKIRSRSRTRSRSRSRSTRRRSRSRSRSRSIRQRSRTPERKSRWSDTPVTSNPTLGAAMSGENLIMNPMGAPMMQMTPHGLMPPYRHQMPMFGAMFYPRPYRPNFNQRPMQMMPLPTQRPNATLVTPEQTRKPIESKLINARDLLLAEREKLRANLKSSEKLLEKKNIELNHILDKDGGKDSYIYKQISKAIIEVKKSIKDTELKLEKNAKQIHDFDKNKNKNEDKRKPVSLSTQKSVNETKDVINKPNNNNELKKTTANDTNKNSAEKPKEDSDDDSDNQRFLYYDGGVHWCKLCDRFFNTIAQYFAHLHSNDHLAKLKPSYSTPWKEKSKNETKPKVLAKNQLRVPCKGHQFIYPTQAFYCSLCKVLSVDSSASEEHFRSPKHNRSYTRYTLLHNNYEMKWKTERDTAYTAMMKREREEEIESFKKDTELRAEKRKKLEEELKRKEKEVKEKIELMNRNAKVVTELDGIAQCDTSSIDKTNDTTTGHKSSKEIKLNLSSHKHKPSDKSRSDNSRGNKRYKSDKTRTKGRDRDVRSDAKSDGVNNERVITSFNDIYKVVGGNSSEVEKEMDYSLFEQELNRLKKELVKQEEFEVRQVVYNLIQAVVKQVDADCGKVNASRSVTQVNNQMSSVVTNKASTNDTSNYNKLQEKVDIKLEKKIKSERKSPIDRTLDTDCKSLDDSCSDELDGFEVIDSVNNDDTTASAIETITISDDEK